MTVFWVLGRKETYIYIDDEPPNGNPHQRTNEKRPSFLYMAHILFFQEGYSREAPRPPEMRKCMENDPSPASVDSRGEGVPPNFFGFENVFGMCKSFR